MNTLPMKYEDNFYVVQANALINTRQSEISVNAMRLVRLALAQITQNDTELFTYQTTVKELSDYFGISAQNIYTEAEKIGKEISEKTVYIEKGKDRKGKANYVIMPWLSEWEYQNGVITIRLNEALKPYLIGLKGYFTEYPIEQIKELKTANAIRLFEVLYSFVWLKYKGNTDKIIINIDKLREILNCENKYSETKDFIKYVIKPTCEQITNKALFPIGYTVLKQGREHTIYAIEFTLDNWNFRKGQIEN